MTKVSLKTRQRKRFKIGDLFVLFRSIAVVNVLLKVLVRKTCWGLYVNLVIEYFHFFLI